MRPDMIIKRKFPVTGFITKFIHDTVMADTQYWNDTIATGPNSSMYGVMGSEGMVKKLSQLYNAATIMAQEFHPNPQGDGQADIRNGAWVTRIETGDGRIYGLMFDDEQKRDIAFGIFKAAVVLVPENGKDADGVPDGTGANDAGPDEVPNDGVDDKAVSDDAGPDADTDEPDSEPGSADEVQPAGEPETKAEESKAAKPSTTRPKVVRV